jgi:hypothetical protein
MKNENRLVSGRCKSPGDDRQKDKVHGHGLGDQVGEGESPCDVAVFSRFNRTMLVGTFVVVSNLSSAVATIAFNRGERGDRSGLCRWRIGDR